MMQSAAEARKVVLLDDYRPPVSPDNERPPPAPRPAAARPYVLPEPVHAIGSRDVALVAA